MSTQVDQVAMARRGREAHPRDESMHAEERLQVVDQADKRSMVAEGRQAAGPQVQEVARQATA
jgi:hypothetical protein